MHSRFPKQRGDVYKRQVQSVVQAGGDQQTVQEGVDAGADAVQASDAVADGHQCVEDDGRCV